METTIAPSDTITVSEMAAMTRVSRSSINSWESDGLVPLLSRRLGEKYKRANAVGLLCVETIKLLRPQVAFSVIEPIARFLASHTPESIEREFREGRSVLVYVTGGVFGPALVRPDDATMAKNATGRLQHHIQLPIERYWHRVKGNMPRRAAPIAPLELEPA